MSNLIDLSRLPPPEVVETLDYETILARRKARYLSYFPADEQPAVAATLALESEPAVKLLQENAYLELVLRQRINDAARARMLAFAKGGDLEHIAALFGVERLTVTPANPETDAPAVMEDDESLCERVQLAPHGFSVAGPTAAYESHARAVDGSILDVAVSRPEPGEILLTILARDGDGTAAPALCEAVTAALSDETLRPLNDTVRAKSAQIVRYRVQAKLVTYRGFDTGILLDAARARLATYVARMRRIRRAIPESGLKAALHVEGVERVVLLEPAAGVAIGTTQAAYCVGSAIEHGGFCD